VTEGSAFIFSAREQQILRCAQDDTLESSFSKARFAIL
jgi:hypothetical protein